MKNLVLRLFALLLALAIYQALKQSHESIIDHDTPDHERIFKYFRY